MIREQLTGIIRKLVAPLKEEDALNSVLKARLTKREYKLLHAWSDATDIADIKSKLKLDEASYETLSQKLIKKLNQEKLKQELCD
jgi:hypothetical protein